MGQKLRHGSLFSGIGGFDLAAQWMGWDNVFHCEIGEYNKRVLKYYWPKAISYDNIKEADFSIHKGAVDIISGGFPCQPFSQAGQRRGKEDDRHLWPEMLRAIREIEPRWVVGENVGGIVTWNDGMVFEEVYTDLEAEGYEVQSFILPAAGVGAPHRRDRVWFIANAKSGRSGRLRNKSQEKRSQDGDELFREPYRVQDEERYVADPDDERCDNRSDYREERRVQDNVYGDAEKSESERSGRVSRISEIDEARNATNAKHTGLEGQHEHSPRLDREDKGIQFGSESSGDECERTPTNTNDDGLQGSVSTEQHKRSSIKEELAKERVSILRRRVSFESFPTQSPVRGRDDGLSEWLVDITLSKWRIESLKSLGNAIVPQIAYNIFKVIEEMEGN